MFKNVESATEIFGKLNLKLLLTWSVCGKSKGITGPGCLPSELPWPPQQAPINVILKRAVVPIVQGASLSCRVTSLISPDHNLAREKWHPHFTDEETEPKGVK